jgi:hypothetical protein
MSVAPCTGDHVFFMNAEEQLHQLLGQLVHSFARFDFNVGLQLVWIGPCRGVEIDHLLGPPRALQSTL